MFKPFTTVLPLIKNTKTDLGAKNENKDHQANFPLLQVYPLNIVIKKIWADIEAKLAFEKPSLKKFFENWAIV